MSIKLGTQNIIGLYKGNTEIVKRYKGNNLIYESLLPYSFEYLYNSLIPTAINNKTVKDKLRLNKIYANAVIENQLCQDNFDTTGYWSRNRVTQTNNNNIATFVSNSNAYVDVSFYHQFTAGQLVKGHKYLVSIKVKLTTGLCKKFSLAMHTNFGASVSNPVQNQWYELSFIWENTRENDQAVNAIICQRTYSSVDDIVIDSDSFEAKEPQLIDLTLREGPGNEPTSLTDNRIQALLNQGYIEYNTGTYKGTNIGEFVIGPYNLLNLDRTTGTLNGGSYTKGNVQDFEENKYYAGLAVNDYVHQTALTNVSISGDTITFTSNSAAYGLALPIKVIAGRAYTLEKTGTNAGTCYVVWYDQNGLFISSNVADNNVSNTAPNNAYWGVIVLRVTPDGATATYSNVCLHRTGTRTGYAPHTQPYTLPFIYQGNSALNAHDTLEITNTEYVFTKNVDNIIYNGNADENWQEYGSGSQRFTILNNLWSSPSSSIVANILCNKLQTCPKNEIFNKEYAISGSDDNVNYFVVRINSSITDVATLKTWLSNNPINVNYELATPQVTRIPRKHLAMVDLGTLDWSYNNGTKRFSTNGVKSSIKHEYGSNNINIYCKNYSANSSGDRVIWCGWNGEVNVNDSSYTDATTFKNAILSTYLFYETEDEVTDIISDINIEAGGTLTSNLFSWVENQLAVLTRESATLRNITFTKNGDNDLSVSGTSQQDENFVIGTFNNITGHKYLVRTIFLSGKPTDSSGYWIKWKTVNYGKDIGDGIIFTGTATENSYIIFTIDNANITVDCRFRLQVIDLTIGFGEGKEPTSVNDPRIQYIIKQGYIPTNTTGTTKTIASEVLPNIDVSFNRK